MLADRKHISIRILEPRHLVSVRSGPDSERAILDERIFLQLDPTLLEAGCHRGDVFHLPAQNGVPRRAKFLYSADADLVLPRFHHQGELIQAHKLEAKLTLVKSPCPIVIRRHQKADQLACLNHWVPP